MEQMQGFQQREDTNVTQKASDDLVAFAGDEKNEFFEDVRTIMADYLEVAANSRRLMTLQEAYDRACMDVPEIKKILAQRAEAAKATPSGDELVRKRRAASSVTGSPNSGSKLNEDASLHDTIAAQFEKAEDFR
jgi:molybdopterin-guanine dinucleotide biosynthesis protein